MKRFTNLIVLAAILTLGACASTGEQSLKDGQGASRAVSSAWNSVSTTEERAMLEGARGGAGLGGLEAEVTMPDGKVIKIKTTGPVRDLNVFTDSVDISSAATISGTSQNASNQGRTDSPSTNTNPEVTVPAK